MTIAKITGMRRVRYADSGQVLTIVSWLDTRGRKGDTVGRAGSAHMQVLIDRGVREGVRLRATRVRTRAGLPKACAEVSCRGANYHVFTLCAETCSMCGAARS